MTSGDVIRPAEEGDLEQLVEIHAASYPDAALLHEAHARSLKQGGLDAIRVLERGGRIVAHAALYRLQLWLGGQRVPTGGVASVAVAPAARRTKSATALLAALHAEIEARGDALALLYPFREGFYAPYGYATVAPLVVLKLACDAVARSPFLAGAIEAAGFSLAMLDGPLFEQARVLYEEASRALAGRLVRDEARWLKLIAREERQWMGVVSSSGRLEGYVAFSYDVPVTDGRQTLIVHEITARDATAQRVLLAALGRQRDQIDDVQITVAWGDPLALAFRDAAGPRRGDPTTAHPLGVLGAGPMVKIVDLEAALTGRGYEADGALTLALPDEAPRRFTVRGGRAEVRAASPDERGARLEIARPVLGSIVAAGMSPGDAAQLGLLWGEPAAIRLADAIFSGPRFRCLDPF